MEAFAIVISIVIGSGVFTSPGAIDTNVPSPGMALVVWLVGGRWRGPGRVPWRSWGLLFRGRVSTNHWVWGWS